MRRWPIGAYIEVRRDYRDETCERWLHTSSISCFILRALEEFKVIRSKKINGLLLLGIIKVIMMVVEMETMSFRLNV